MGGYKPTKAALAREVRELKVLERELREQLASVGAAPDTIKLAPAQLGAIIRGALDDREKRD